MEVPAPQAGEARRLPAEAAAALGLSADDLLAGQVLQAREGRYLLRLRRAGEACVLKWSHGPEARHEARAYALLADLGVPTLRVLARAEAALLLEDLDASPSWRLATPEDVSQSATGRAVTEWYRALHGAGRRWQAAQPVPPEWLPREADALTPERLRWMGARLDMPGDPLWDLAAGHIASLQAAARSLPETLTYNDFFWANLALSRPRDDAARQALRAVVFDLHLLGIGLRHSDCRNVTSSLGPAAASAFRQAYGPTDRREALLDAALAPLYSLWVAIQRTTLPAWVEEDVRRLGTGALERALRAALAAL